MYRYWQHTGRPRETDTIKKLWMASTADKHIWALSVDQTRTHSLITPSHTPQYQQWQTLKFRSWETAQHISRNNNWSAVCLSVHHSLTDGWPDRSFRVFRVSDKAFACVRLPVWTQQVRLQLRQCLHAESNQCCIYTSHRDQLQLQTDRERERRVREGWETEQSHFRTEAAKKSNCSTTQSNTHTHCRFQCRQIMLSWKDHADDFHVICWMLYELVLLL